MKNLMLTLIATAMCVAPLSAQTAPEAQTQEPQTQAAAAPAAQSAPAVKEVRKVEPRVKYTNFAYVSQRLYEPETDVELGRSKLGVAFTTGRTINFHRRPIANTVFIGLDMTWFELQYAQYEKPIGLGEKLHMGDLTMFGIGPSVSVYPVGRLFMHAYLRYNPTLSTYFNGDMDMMGGYASMMVSGLSVSWSAISIGAEARWGKGKYSSMFGDFKKSITDDIIGDVVPDDLSNDLVLEDDEKTPSHKLKSTAFRVYLSLRF